MTPAEAAPEQIECCPVDVARRRVHGPDPIPSFVGAHESLLRDVVRLVQVARQEEKRPEEPLVFSTEEVLETDRGLDGLGGVESRRLDHHTHERPRTASRSGPM
jgi:hypothetical protein